MYLGFWIVSYVEQLMFLSWVPVCTFQFQFLFLGAFCILPFQFQLPSDSAVFSSLLSTESVWTLVSTNGVGSHVFFSKLPINAPLSYFFKYILHHNSVEPSRLGYWSCWSRYTHPFRPTSSSSSYAIVSIFYSWMPVPFFAQIYAWATCSLYQHQCSTYVKECEKRWLFPLLKTEGPAVVCGDGVSCRLSLCLPCMCLPRMICAQY